MASRPSRVSSFFSLYLLFSVFSFVAQASVPPSARFKYVNEGDFGDYVVEYGANYRALDPFSQPFQLCFYNTTPNAFTLALRMGTVRSETLMRWVWEANRGNPVRENATLTFGEDGNLVLADADGRIAWQTNTANNGVVGFKLLPNGNMVLHDLKGKLIWQSFNYPTDTLLVGQSLRLGAATKLVSRASAEENNNGPYSLVVEAKTLSMYYKSPSSLRPYLYFSFSNLFSVSEGALEDVTVNPDLSWTYQATDSGSGGTLSLVTQPYNTTLSYIRLERDGNLKFYTYTFDSNPSGGRAWVVSYTLFDRDPISLETTCQLPETCGSFGLCQDNQCVACPTPNGLLSWSKDCKSPKLSSCGPRDFRYYKLEGVDHFLCKYTKGEGPMKQASCSDKCTKDCKCLGYFYHTQSSRCWITYDLKTLTKVANSTHLAYIKTPI